MKNNANYMILPEFSLILECCRGNTSVEDAIHMKKTELSDKLYNPNYNIIVDFQEFKTSLDSTVKDSTVDFFSFLKDLNINCRIAFLTAEPHQVVISMILKELNSNLEAFKIEVFSTLEAAIGFLGYTAGDLDKISGKIRELKNNTSN
jgi:hypothetical protein